MTAKLNRVARGTAAVLAAIAVGAGAAACDASTGTSSGAQSATSPRTTTTTRTAGETVGIDAVNASSVAAISRCHTGDLRITWDSRHGGHPDMDATYQQIAAIRLTNTTGHACTLKGFPGVRLISTSGEAWDLVRSADKPSTITLGPGDDTALITLSILPVAKNDPDTKPFVPAKVQITPPDETSHVTLSWPYGGAILDQSGATHPGTFVNPVGVG